MKKPALTLALLCCSIFLFGQSATKGISWPGSESNFTKEKIGLPFLQVDSSFYTLNGTRFNFLETGANTFVYFGMYGCKPCMEELPSIVAVAKVHPEIRFVYTSYNEGPTIKKEFTTLLGKGYQLPANFHIVTMSQLFIALQNLTICYPVKYFLDKKGVVQYMQYTDMKSFNGTEYPDFFAANQAVIETYSR